MKNKIVPVVSMILSLLLVFGLVAAVLQVFTPYKPSDWFKKDDVVVDEPVVEEVLPLVASNEEEMSALLIEENVGRTVTYTGETVKNVTLPFEKGESIGCICMDTSLNLDDFILGLDWDNPHFVETGGPDFELEYIFLMVHGTCSIEQLIGYTTGDFEFDDSVYGEPLLYVVKQVHNGTGDTVGHILIMDNAALYYVLNPEFDYDRYIDSFDVQPGWTDLATYMTDGYPCEIDGIGDVHSSYMTGDCLFFGVVEAIDENTGFKNFGSVEIVYDTDRNYLICKNDDNSGYHFEIVV